MQEFRRPHSFGKCTKVYDIAAACQSFGLPRKGKWYFRRQLENLVSAVVSTWQDAADRSCDGITTTTGESGGVMSEQKKWIIGVLLAILAACYFGYQRHHQAKLDEFRVFLETNGNSRIRPIRENKAEQLGLSKSEVAQILIEAQAARDFDRR